MRRGLTILVFSILCFYCSAVNRHAFVIGIGAYPEGSGWSQIHGDNDVPIIKAKLLLSGFEDRNIKTLINAEATYSAIIEEFQALRSRAKLGDVIYIHFSGHGQQVTDLNGDEEDGYDEAWIPYDAPKIYRQGIYEGENHLIDDKINELLTELRSAIGAKGHLVVVADACHSGSGSRGYDSDIICYRGTRDKFEIPNNSQRHIDSHKAQPVNWLFIAACKDYQVNFEYRSSEGTYYGALSYVISNDANNLLNENFDDIISRWKIGVKECIRNSIGTTTKLPFQEITHDGQPSVNSDKLF